MLQHACRDHCLVRLDAHAETGYLHGAIQRGWMSAGLDTEGLAAGTAAV